MRYSFDIYRYKSSIINNSQDDGIDKFLDEIPQDNIDPSKDLPRRKIGLPPIHQIFGATLWTLIGSNIGEVIKNALENKVGDPPFESNNNAQKRSDSNSTSSISDDSQKLNEKVKLIQPFTKIIDFKAGNIKNELLEWKKITSDK